MKSNLSSAFVAGLLKYFFDGFKYDFELSVMFLVLSFEVPYPLTQHFVVGQHLLYLREGPHDLDIGVDGGFAA